jgi:hypothetical protein
MIYINYPTIIEFLFVVFITFLIYLFYKYIISFKHIIKKNIGLTIPKKGKFTNHDLFLLKYKSFENNFFIEVYKPTIKKIFIFNYIKYNRITTNKMEMTYIQFISYLYAEGYLDNVIPIKK